MSNRFSQWSSRIATISGYWETFVLMTLVCLLWALSGPFFGYSDTWQLVINTATTVLTFLMVFLIQNTQNRDSVAVHLKLDELLSSIDEADNEMMLAEHATDEELEALKEKYRQLCDEVEHKLGSAPATT
jgi:low affinity Fe/Cu permease